MYALCAQRRRCKMSGQGGKGGGAVQAPNLNSGGGKGILPPGSMSTQDLRPDGMSTTEFNFLEKHGKPFSEMTPEEQFAVQNPQPTAGRYNEFRPMAPMRGDGGNMAAQPTNAGFNVNNAAASGLQNAMGATTGAIYNPLNVGAFNNPYQQEVIDNTQADIERQRQMAINNMGAGAQGSGAYGGSRHGVAEGVTNAEYGRVAANTLGNLRMQGYNNAMANAMADRNFRLGAANQLGGLSNQAFNTGRIINQDLAAQGLMQQGLQQALIDAAKGDFANYAGSPGASLSAPLAALGASPKPTAQTSTENPGILNILGAIKYLSGPTAALPIP